MTRNHQHHCPMGVQKPPYPPQLRKTNWSQNPKIQWTIIKTSWKHHENSMKTSWKHHGNIMETSWKHHENILQLKIPNLCLGSKICVGRVRMRVCGPPKWHALQDDGRTDELVCHGVMPCHATKNSSPRFPQHLSRANTVPLRWCDVFFLSHAAAASHERWDMMGWLLDVNGIPDTWW